MFGIFKSPFKVRLHGVETIENGNAAYPYTETTANLDVQLADDHNTVSEEGDNRTTKLIVYSDFPFAPAEREWGKPGDWLSYRGFWYECIGSAHHLHTPSQHYVSDFIRIPDLTDDEEGSNE